jgi:hypothetical protein
VQRRKLVRALLELHRALKEDEIQLRERVWYVFVLHRATIGAKRLLREAANATSFRPTVSGFAASGLSTNMIVSARTIRSFTGFHHSSMA